MSEVKRQPHRLTTAEGVPVVGFDDSHSTSDILRYLVDECYGGDPSDVLWLLGENWGAD